jgi:hypothetical protein
MSRFNKILLFSGFIIAIVIGMNLSDLMKMAGLKRSIGEKGGMIRITGSCSVRSGGNVTLTSDTVRIIKETENEIEAVLISDAKYLRCPLSSVFVESFSILDLFNKRKVQTEATKDTREVERDPVMDFLKKTVLASGICKVGKSELIVSDKVMDIVDIKESEQGIFEMMAIIKTGKKQVVCTSNRVKMNIITEEDIQRFLDKEDKEGKVASTSYKGRTILVTGLCAKRIDGKTAKNQMVDVSSQPVKVTEEVMVNGTVIKIYGKSKDESGELISIDCSKEVDPGLLFEESTGNPEADANKDGIKVSGNPVNLKVTGKCRSQDGKMVDLYDQFVKVVSSTQDKSGAVLTAKVKVKNKDGVIDTLDCDKKASVLFDKAE